jgi:HEAT repeat protein
MLDHLINFDPEVQAHPGNFVPMDRTDPSDVVDGMAKTVDWLKELGAVDTDTLVSEAQSQAARAAFTNIVTAKPAEMTHTSLANIKTPEAVQRLVGMLSAYDWEFVQQAKEIRGYTVAKLVEETEHPNANIRLKALGLLGKVTEVGLFTEKIEVKKTEMSDVELEARIKEKLNRFMGVIDVVEADVVEESKDADEA